MQKSIDHYVQKLNARQAVKKAIDGAVKMVRPREVEVKKVLPVQENHNTNNPYLRISSVGITQDDNISVQATLNDGLMEIVVTKHNEEIKIGSLDWNKPFPEFL